jgi:hypothetical protein
MTESSIRSVSNVGVREAARIERDSARIERKSVAMGAADGADAAAPIPGEPWPRFIGHGGVEGTRLGQESWLRESIPRVARGSIPDIA